METTKESRPVQESNRVILFVPGMNAQKQQSLFQTLKKEARARGMDAICLDAWSSGADLETLSIDDIVRSIREQSSSLASQGYEYIYGIGKSFGGGMLLAAKDQFIRRLVLWAPAITTDEGDGPGTIESLRDRSLDSVGSILSITLSKNLLKSIKTPVDILHGVEDDVIPLKNSELFCSLIPDARLHPLEGKGHSPKDEQEILELIHASLDLIT